MSSKEKTKALEQDKSLTKAEFGDIACYSLQSQYGPEFLLLFVSVSC